MRSELGDFLRARRRLVRPADVGLPGNGLRRVPGLRREEVALLAGISAEYYLRLEQGRDRTPSAQVVEAIARVLRLDADATSYALALAQPRRRPPLVESAVPAGIEMLLATLNVPAFVVNRYRDVVAANALAVALSPLMATGVNRVLAVFTDPLARDYHPDLDENAAGYVAQLRAEIGTDTDDPRYRALIDELNRRSPLFRELWARHDIQRGGNDTSVIRHPRLGDLRLRREKLAVIGADRLMMVVYHAEPGTPSASALASLGVRAAGGDAPAINLPAGLDDHELVGEVDGGADVVGRHP
ncbi:helix-turn-helix domain-containing protein [Actinoplanes solisilvae]|uniref:helix-turn-helix domain-containing protein n=1 Tax=Actinoplanes solisilvae TaxID=2486853 RepID=UPI000FD7ED67|nr:helix-turn-helix transcriptional regulator [Actinoplanes solisilvae]